MSFWRTFGWGVFCACSWTWCIGMYVPLLFLKYFGWPGVMVFAVPNIAGCVAFGYVLRDRARSSRILEHHRVATGWFSIATLAYHTWFAAWFVTRLWRVETPWLAPAAGVALLLAARVIALLPTRFWPLLAVIVLGTSIAAFFQSGVGAVRSMPFAGSEPSIGLLWLAPAVGVGFILCPYLDRTFHRARQSAGPHAFGVFGVAFAIMLILTCSYREMLETWAIVPFAHLITQSLFTVAAHLRELHTEPPTPSAGATPTPATGMAWVYALPIVAAVAPILGAGLASDETYIRFLVLYGLVFPAYVLLFVGPGPVLSRTRRRHVMVAAITVAALLLPAELGFVRLHTPWLLVPVGVLLGLKMWAVTGIRLSPNQRRDDVDDPAS